MRLVIVESPTKAKTVSKFLGSEFAVESSYGHVRDLPKSKLGIDTEADFEPQYVVPRNVQARVTALKKAAAKSDAVILATDEDREGEAIAWHLSEALGLAGRADVSRIVFHEITEGAIKEALAHPRALNMDLVDAQQARRVLDRIVGYKLSPFLWKKVARGLSAGRVQSVALRLIADREAEIQAFKPEEYWTIGVALEGAKGAFEAALSKRNGNPIAKLEISTKKEAERIKKDLESSSFSVLYIEEREVRKNPMPPFTTSTLQQTAAKRLGLTSKKTMYLAQQLYELGHITYMRTDSVNISREALAASRRWIEANLPSEYLIPDPRVFKKQSRLAQEAHEAIRPTRADHETGDLSLEKDQAKLYDLIWRRFIASQLPSALFNATHVAIGAASKNRSHELIANGNVLRFDGFLKIWPTKFEEKELPQLKKDEALQLNEVVPVQHFTEPPPRYNEASLIKTLEEYGIGRPSTYAPIISVIQERNYAEKRQGRFYPTEVGILVNKVLKENFPEIVDIQFTAKMEEELDRITEHKVRWRSVIREFYDPFAKHLAEKYETVTKQNAVAEKTNEICEKCGKPMVIRFGRFGRFLACSGFPECKNTKALNNAPKPIGMKCPKCLESPDRRESPGDVIERYARKGRARGKKFWGCSRYPECDYASWTNPLGTREEAHDTGAVAEK